MVMTLRMCASGFLRAVGVILHRHRGQVLARGAVLIHVAARDHREQRGKVAPARTSPHRSPAPARISVTFGVGCEVIFSTPVTRTTSYSPAATADTAWKNADPLEAQAASKRVAGIPVMPIAAATYGAR